MKENLIEIYNKILFGNGVVDSHFIEEWTKEDWEYAFDFSSQHGLTTLFAPVLLGASRAVPSAKELVLMWYGVLENHKISYGMKIDIMQELALLFQQNGINVLFLKGAAIAQLYPFPELRMFSDIDYYLFGKSQEGIKILETKGIITNEYEHHHTQSSYKGVLLENHYDFFDCINHRCNHVLEKAMKELAHNEGMSVRFDFGDDNINNAFMLTPTMNAIFLMRHMSGHFVAETVSLRMLYDWALFLKKQSTDVDWDLVIRLYYESGMMEFANNVQYIINERMKVAVDSPLKASNKYADRIWKSIFQSQKQNPYTKYSLRYNIFETRIFFANRWKHSIVYPNESYLRLFISYVLLTLKRKVGLLKHTPYCEVK